MSLIAQEHTYDQQIIQLDLPPLMFGNTFRWFFVCLFFMMCYICMYNELNWENRKRPELLNSLRLWVLQFMFSNLYNCNQRHITIMETLLKVFKLTTIKSEIVVNIFTSQKIISTRKWFTKIWQKHICSEGSPVCFSDFLSIVYGWLLAILSTVQRNNFALCILSEYNPTTVPTPTWKNKHTYDFMVYWLVIKLSKICLDNFVQETHMIPLCCNISFHLHEVRTNTTWISCGMLQVHSISFLHPWVGT